MSESVLPMVSSRSFIVSGLTFRSLIHFEFIFVYFKVAMIKTLVPKAFCNIKDKPKVSQPET